MEALHYNTGYRSIRFLLEHVYAAPRGAAKTTPDNYVLLRKHSKCSRYSEYAMGRGNASTTISILPSDYLLVRIETD